MAGILDFLRSSPDTRKALEAYRAQLYRVAYSWTHQPSLADDLVQETLAKALVKSGQLRDPQAGRAWLYTVMANCYRDHFRKRRETEDVDALELAADTQTPEDAVGALDVAAKVRGAIARLPEGQRQVVTLVDLEGFSYIEVSKILDVPIGTVMSRLCRARASLKDLLTDLRTVDLDVTGTKNLQRNGATKRLWRVK